MNALVSLVVLAGLFASEDVVSPNAWFQHGNLSREGWLSVLSMVVVGRVAAPLAVDCRRACRTTGAFPERPAGVLVAQEGTT